LVQVGKVKQDARNQQARPTWRPPDRPGSAKRLIQSGLHVPACPDLFAESGAKQALRLPADDAD
jgi:hypothetical protein